MNTKTISDTMRAMQIRVGPFSYQIQIVAGDIAFAGQACLGLCDNEAMILYLSDNVPIGQRVAVLCHEYMEAWVYHFGRGLEDKEDWCDLFGAAMTQFIQDLAESLNADAHTVLMGQAVAAPPSSPTPTEVALSGSAPQAQVPVRKVGEYLQPPRPGANQTWRIRVYEPGEPSQEEGPG